MNDFSTHVPKIQTRRSNLSLVRLSRCLWSKTSHSLRYDWLELAGDYAPTLNEILLQDMLFPGKFIGVDHNVKIIERCRKRYGSDSAVSWLHADLFNLIQNNDERLNNVGVLNFDSMRIGSAAPAQAEVELVCQFARQQYDRLGEFLLILNFVCRGGFGPVLEATDFALQKELNVKAEDYIRYPARGGRFDMLHTQIRLGF